MIPTSRRVLARATTLGLLFALGAPATVTAHETPIVATPRPVSTTTAALRLSGDLMPLAARYAVTAVAAPKVAGHPAAPATQHVWYFFRDGLRVALLKGSIDEVWHRDDQGRLRFERVFHDDQRAVDYSAGELATLGIRAEWLALARFVDPEALAALRVVSRTGAGASERVRMTGQVGVETLRVDWMPALQLPARLLRTARNGASTDIRLVQHAATAPTDWPSPGLRSADYLRLDAADFGDMEYEAVVRKSEALDIRLGWRSTHQHD